MHQLTSMLYNRDEEDYRIVLYFSAYGHPLSPEKTSNIPCFEKTMSAVKHESYFRRIRGEKFGREIYEGENAPDRHLTGIYWEISTSEIFDVHTAIDDSNGTHLDIWLWMAVEYNTSDSKTKESECIMIDKDTSSAGYDISTFVNEQIAVNRNKFIVRIINVGLILLVIAVAFLAVNLLQRKWQKLWRDSKPTPAQLTLYPVREPSDDLSEPKWPTGDRPTAETTELGEPLNSISDSLKDENDNLLNRYFPAETPAENTFDQLPLIESDNPGYKFNPLQMITPNHQKSQVLQSAPTLQPQTSMQPPMPLPFNSGMSGGYKSMEAIEAIPFSIANEDE